MSSREFAGQTRVLKRSCSWLTTIQRAMADARRGDEGAGVAALLEVARILAQDPPETI